MRDHDDQLLFGNLFQDLHDLHAGDRIERAGGLVGQQNVGIVDQRAGDRHALHLTAGHLVGLFVQLVTKADLLQRVNGAGTALLAGHARKGERQLHVGKHGLVHDQVIALEYKADRVIAIGIPVGIAVLLGGATANDQITAGVAVKTANDIQHRGLSAAGGAEDRHEFALTEVDADALQGVNLAITRGIGLHDVAQ